MTEAGAGGPEAGRLTPRYVSGAPRHDVTFTFATLVADERRYQRLVDSLDANGFHAGNTELIALDNRTANNFDGFTYLRRAVLEARGRYIVLTHDDVELMTDGYDALVRVLDEMTALDETWAVAGNAGMTWTERHVLHLIDPNVDHRVEHPVAVQSLDENFMIVRRDRLVLHALDLEGFHLYGADLCLQAEMQGVGRSYVVPFLLRHHSRGRMDAGYYEVRSRFSRKYARYHRHRRVRTTVDTVFLGGPSVPQRAELLSEAVARQVRRVARRLSLT